VAYAHAGVGPKYLGVGSTPAVKKVLDKAGLKIEDLDVIEPNEAFAAQAPGGDARPRITRRQDHPERQRYLARPPDRGDRLHPDGQGAPQAAAHRRSYGLVTMCIGGGKALPPSSSE
jgi:acetyl-CoA C-acetyltransferase